LKYRRTVGGKASARTSGRQAAALVITAFAGACGGGGDDDTKNGRAKASSLPLAANGMIAFSRSENVYVADASGRSVERMTSGPGRGARGPFYYEAAWAPDGIRLAFRRVTYPTHEYGDVDDFLAAVTGHSAAHAAGKDVAEARVAELSQSRGGSPR
jgi:hypothetical protein